MNKAQFIKLLENAQADENGNLYYIEYIGEREHRVYFATITTICDDFVKEYCYDDGKGKECGRYDRHFTHNDDTLEIFVVKEVQDE